MVPKSRNDLSDLHVIMSRRVPGWRVIGASIIALAISACDNGTSLTAPPDVVIEAEEPAQEVPQNPSAAFYEMAASHAQQLLREYPEGATQLGVSEEIGGEGYNARLAGYGFEAQEKMRALNETFLQELRSFDRETLDVSAKASYDVLKNAYDLAARRNAFVYGGASAAGGSAPQIGAEWAITPYYVTQLTGPHLVIPRMMQTQQALETVADAEAYISRLNAFDRAFDEIIETVRSDAASGVTPPVFSIDAVIASAKNFTAQPAAEHPLVTTIAEKAAAIDGLEAEDRAALVARAATAVEAVVYPAYQKLGETFEAIKPQATPGAGVWRLGEIGEGYYQLALDAYGAGGRTGDEVHEIGLSEVARIQGEMDAILKTLDLADGSVADRLGELSARDGALYPNTDEGRAALLEALRDQVAEVMAIAPDWFNTLPEQKVEVRRIPVYEQDSSPGGYYSGPSLDGSRPGIYWINLKNTADNPKMGLPTLTYHEAVPGHHFQISLQQAVKEMPLMRNLVSYSEFSEGWALYGEALAKEMGMYDDDPLGDLGRLQAELFRAARLVVDTGLHHKRWTREEAIDYMTAATGETRASVTREIERYAAVPGQACSYKLGMLRLQEMRARAEAELGDEFDIRAFHDEILLAGAMPMEVLDARINEWIATRKEG